MSQDQVTPCWWQPLPDGGVRLIFAEQVTAGRSRGGIAFAVYKTTGSAVLVVPQVAAWRMPRSTASASPGRAADP